MNKLLSSLILFFLIPSMAFSNSEELRNIISNVPNIPTNTLLDIKPDTSLGNKDLNEAREEGLINAEQSGMLGMLTQGAESKDRFRMDLKDEILKKNNNARLLKEEGCIDFEHLEDSQITEKFCEEGVRKVRQCENQIINLEVKEIPAEYTEIKHFICKPNRFCEKKWRNYEHLNGTIDHSQCPVPCRHATDSTWEISKPVSVEVVKENTFSSCLGLEKLNYCTVTNRECVDETTRTYLGFEFKRCWKESVTYQCGEEFNQCDQKNCVVTNFECIQTDDQNNCLKYKKKLKCAELNSNGTERICGTEIPKYIAPNNYTPNPHFGKAMSELSIFGEIKNESFSDSFRIMRGHAMSCRHFGYGFSNCCKESGWGQDVNLDQCNEEEKALGLEKQNGQCIELGDYCAERVLGQCVKKRRGYCCYNGKLARIFNQQGIPQTGRNFGGPESPICEGFSVEDFSEKRVKADLIDFSDYFSDIKGKLNPEDKASVVNRITNYINERINTLTE